MKYYNVILSKEEMDFIIGLMSNLDKVLETRINVLEQELTKEESKAYEIMNYICKKFDKVINQGG